MKHALWTLRVLTGEQGQKALFPLPAADEAQAAAEARDARDLLSDTEFQCVQRNVHPTGLRSCLDIYLSDRIPCYSVRFLGEERTAMDSGWMFRIENWLHRARGIHQSKGAKKGL